MPLALTQKALQRGELYRAIAEHLNDFFAFFDVGVEPAPPGDACKYHNLRYLSVWPLHARFRRHQGA